MEDRLLPPPAVHLRHVPRALRGAPKSTHAALHKYGVNAVWSGHEHVYERIKPQNGIYFFLEGESDSSATTTSAVPAISTGRDSIRTAALCWSKLMVARCTFRPSRALGLSWTPVRSRFKSESRSKPANIGIAQSTSALPIRRMRSSPRRGRQTSRPRQCPVRSASTQHLHPPATGEAQARSSALMFLRYRAAAPLRRWLARCPRACDRNPYSTGDTGLPSANCPCARHACRCARAATDRYRAPRQSSTTRRLAPSLRSAAANALRKLVLAPSACWKPA